MLRLQLNNGDSLYIHSPFYDDRAVYPHVSTMIGMDLASPVKTVYRSSKGVAYRSRRDFFDARRGRKIALTRAIGELGLSKEQRREIWEQILILL